MNVHVDETRHHEAPACVDLLHTVGRSVCRGGDDPPVLDHHRPVLQDPLGVHRQDVDADERQVAFHHDPRLAAAGARRDADGQHQHARRRPPPTAAGHAFTSGRAPAYSGTCPRR